ncbi:unnamed protein product [Gongylonema pulchrum]|uniref:KH_dom_type_1 domain-containing protein n=1 Tax=Gongylonema pulchrum TaxID=637853 RepID=A0A183EUB8_9BILA|nr:unnamed protein product [Gongylonema pulchrum]
MAHIGGSGERGENYQSKQGSIIIQRLGRVTVVTNEVRRISVHLVNCIADEWRKQRLRISVLVAGKQRWI